MNARSFRIVLLSIVAAILGVVVLVSPAEAQTPANICAAGPQCLNLWGDNQHSGALIKYYHYGSSGGNNGWNITTIGHVIGVNCTSNCWPFYPGSGLNARYNGNFVLTFPYTKNTSFCADQTSYEAQIDYGNLEIQPCANGDDYQLFVYSSSGFLVGVHASDLYYIYSGKSNTPVWLGGTDGNVGDGEVVTMSTQQSWSTTYVFLSPGGSPIQL